MTGKLDSGRFFHNRRGFSLGKDVTGESLLPSPFAIRSELSQGNSHWRDPSFPEGDPEKVGAHIGSEISRIAGITPRGEIVREVHFKVGDDTTLSQCLGFAREIERKYGIRIYEMHLHRDEGTFVQSQDGSSIWKPNYHVHGYALMVITPKWMKENGEAALEHQARIEAQADLILSQKMADLERARGGDRLKEEALLSCYAERARKEHSRYAKRHPGSRKVLPEMTISAIEGIMHREREDFVGHRSWYGGRMVNPSMTDLSQMQDILSECLGMERGYYVSTAVMASSRAASEIKVDLKKYREECRYIEEAPLQDYGTL